MEDFQMPDVENRDSLANKISALLERIDRVFPKSEAIESESITKHPCDECIAIRNDFAGVAWWSADPELIDAYFTSLSLFTPKAFHYYLPAYLVYSLNHFEPFEGAVEFSIYALSLELDDPRRNKWLTERKNLFTEEQRQVIVKFLELVRDHPEMEIYQADVVSGIEFWKR